MSSVHNLFILLINCILHINSNSQCDLLSAIDLQSATYSHSIILRVQPVYSSEEILENFILRKVFIREILKIPTRIFHSMKVNDTIFLRIEQELDEMLDDSCWQLLRMENADIILFLNDTTRRQFHLQYPPVESTLRVRENIQTVLNYETYSPQIIIKTRLDKPILLHDYSLQCNARGNPIPRLLWSKNNQSSEYYPTAKQCKTPCRIYSIQNKYQSTLYFQSLMNSDEGFYICHAENLLNHTTANIYLDLNENTLINRSMMNMTCDNLKFCHERGQCLVIDSQLKCLCDRRYFGEQCETDYDEMVTNHQNTLLLFKSRFLTGTILLLVVCSLIFIGFISCFLSKYNQAKQKQISRAKLLRQTARRKTELLEQPLRIDQHRTASLPHMQVGNDRNQCMKHSSTMENNYLSLKTHQIDEINLDSKMNHLILPRDYLDFYQPDVESGLIRPLTIEKDVSKRHTRLVPTQNRFLQPHSNSHR
ncbi:unnamed protein product [Adineta ricciae]|uniref:Uncharacterized protein n=1 Tax=Adineta ricciae TaxID=249248 RepID=A0A816F2M4_ADIRI|nr:unnamed protein product [Adineta ricciae]